VVLADNDQQGAKDLQIVRNYLNGRVEQEALYVMPEANIEQHLCMNGYVDVYRSLLSAEPLKRVTAQPNDPTYPIQVAQSLPRQLKTHAAQQVVASMRDSNRPVPQLFQNVINAAIILTQTP
jgi:hypothetical protein